jgi:hypothetical protein
MLYRRFHPEILARPWVNLFEAGAEVDVFFRLPIGRGLFR